MEMVMQMAMGSTGHRQLEPTQLGLLVVFQVVTKVVTGQ
jgi:hypothetical protein